MKNFLITIVFTLLASKAFATAQFPDILIYEGENQSIFANPLEAYFSEENPRPDDLFDFSCTANWRGYVATWKIENDYLYLVKLIEGTCYPDAPEIPLDKIFLDQQPPIKATWFSGTLRVPMGEMIEYVHMGYESIYEKELLITIENGRVIKKEIIENSIPELPEK